MSTMSTEMKENEPWYKQWMVWMVITPPAAAVIAGIITINLAISSDDGLVVDDYYKQGLGINQTLQRDKLARDLALESQLFIEDKVVKIRFTKPIDEQVLKLSFIHPTQSHQDVIVNVNHFSDNAFKAELSQVITGNWNLLLEPDDKSWRIMGRINLPQQSSSMMIPNLK